MIRVTDSIEIDEKEFEEQFVRSSGPGGQNVNKVASAVQLRFDARRSRALPDAVAIRLMELAGKKLTKDGVIVLTADRFRTQEMNRSDAQDRLVELIRQAAAPPPPKRRATKPTKASKERRLTEKKGRGGIKKLRTSRPGED